MESCLRFDRVAIEPMTQDIFLKWYPGRHDMWQVYLKIRHDWVSRYGSIDRTAIVQGKKISFLSKITWAFRFMEEMEMRRMKHGSFH